LNWVDQVFGRRKVSRNVTVADMQISIFAGERAGAADWSGQCL
jgi:hypothetical protein